MQKEKLNFNSLKRLAPENLQNLTDRFYSDVATRTDTPDLPLFLPTMNEMMFGFHRGKITNIGARTSHGKSAFMANCAVHLSGLRKNVLFLTLEDKTIELYERIFCLLTGTNNRDARRGILRVDRSRVDSLMKKHDMIILDSYGFNLSEIDEIYNLTHFRNGKKADVMFLDYVGRLEMFVNYEKVSLFINQLDFWAQHQSVAMVISAQLNRAGVKEMGHDTFKMSGSLEEVPFHTIILRYPYNLGLDEYDPDDSDLQDIRDLESEDFRQGADSVDYRSLISRRLFHISLGKGKDALVRHKIPFDYQGAYYRFNEWTCPYAMFRGGCTRHGFEFPEITNEHENEKEGGV